MVANNYAVQTYSYETDRKLDVILVPNIYGIDDESETFTEEFEPMLDEYLRENTLYSLEDVYYSVL